MTAEEKTEKQLEKPKHSKTSIPIKEINEAWLKHFAKERSEEKEQKASPQHILPTNPVKISKGTIERLWEKHEKMVEKDKRGQIRTPNRIREKNGGFERTDILRAIEKHRKSEAQKLSVKTIISPSHCSRRTRKGDHVSFKYVGTIDKSSPFGVRGQLFDQGTFICKLGNGEVIDGMDTGLIGTCLHEKREIIIPSHLGYGDEGSGALIPGGATLHFEIEMLHID